MRQAPGGMHRKPLTHHPSQRQPAVRELLDAERIDQCQHVAAQLLDRVVARHRGRSAVSARVEAKHPEVRCQGLNLRVPHPVIETQRMRQHQDGFPFGAVEPVVQVPRRRRYEWHEAQRFPDVGCPGGTCEQPLTEPVGRTQVRLGHSQAPRCRRQRAGWRVQGWRPRLRSASRRTAVRPPPRF